MSYFTPNPYKRKSQHGVTLRGYEKFMPRGDLIERLQQQGFSFAHLAGKTTQSLRALYYRVRPDDKTTPRGRRP